MAKFVLGCVLLSLIVVVYSADPLKCYNCADCKAENGKEIVCGAIAGSNNVPACVKYTFTDKGTKNITRKCVQVDPKDNKFNCQFPQGATDTTCDTCLTSLCNAAENVKINSFSLMALSTVSLIFVKMLLH